MPAKQIFILSCICIIATLFVPASADLESPPVLKEYVTYSPADDMHFFQQVSDLLMPHSGGKLPTEPDVTYMFTVFSLVGSSYNVEDWKTAQSLLSFIFYTGKAGEAYQQYLNAGQIGFVPGNYNEIYDLARQYHLAARKVYESCQKCSTYLPEFVMYSLPQKGTPKIKRDTHTPPTTLAPSDPTKPYDDERFDALADNWFYAYLLTETEAGYIAGYSLGEEPSVRILRGNGPSQAQQIYVSALGMNFSPEIQAYASELISFFYAISHAGNEFAAFEDEKVRPSTITKGRPEYDRASDWYKTAQKALDSSGLTRQGMKLPALISFSDALKLPRGIDPTFQEALTPYFLSDKAKERGIQLFR